MSAISRCKTRFALPIWVPLATVLTVLTVLTACASTSGSSSGGKAEKAEAAAATSSSSSALPAVSNSKDLAVKPSVSPGKPPAPATLQTHDLVTGSGATATAASTVSVRYLGVNFADGKEFDSSWSSGKQPVDFPLSSVIPGFAQGIVGMQVGGRREIVIPPSLGYGAQGSGPIGPNETLVFVVDLVKVT
jgi:peptidylprolyl isomerase